MPLDHQDELFYLVDENDLVLGSVSRKQAHTDRTKIHRSIAIILCNHQGKVLMQKRSMKKDKNPGLWCESVGGHVTFGDSYEITAQRELQEELGIQVPLQRVTKIFVDSGDQQEFCTIFKGEYQQLPTQFDQDEVSEVAFMEPAQIALLKKKQLLSPMSIPVFQAVHLL